MQWYISLTFIRMLICKIHKQFVTMVAISSSNTRSLVRHQVSTCASPRAKHVFGRRFAAPLTNDLFFKMYQKNTIKRDNESMITCHSSSNSAGLPSYSELQKVAEEAARAGASIVYDTIDKPRNVTLKGTADLVTETDTASEKAVLDVIRKYFPNHAVLGEEGGVSGDVTSEYLWAVDPLDGTTNFTHGYPSFAVCVACLRHAVPVASTVIEFAGGPGTWVQREYSAKRNGGATMNGTRISVSKTKDLGSSLVVTGFGYDHDAPWLANMGLFKEFTDITRGVRRLGSAAIDMCHVASGITDAYWEYRLKPWDMAAGVLMVEEAGGTVTTMDGRAFSVFDRSVLVSNSYLHESLLEIIEPVTTDLVTNKGVDLSQWFIPAGYSVHSGAQLE